MFLDFMSEVEGLLREALNRCGFQLEEEVNCLGLDISPHADLSSSVAFRLAPLQKKSPAMIAKVIHQAISGNYRFVDRIELSGPYLNFFMNREFLNITLSQSIADDCWCGKMLQKVIVEHTSANQLAACALGAAPVMASLGLATINALLLPQSELWSDENASEIIARYGAGQRVVMVGRFPFAAEILPRLGELLVLEQDPGPEDLPAAAAPQVLPGADVVAITGMTISNHTLEGLLDLCSPQAKVVLLGPSVPLSPVFFDYGVDVVSGSVVTDIASVLRLVSQGGNFRQVHHAGVRLVNLYK